MLSQGILQQAHSCNLKTQVEIILDASVMVAHIQERGGALDLWSGRHPLTALLLNLRCKTKKPALSNGTGFAVIVYRRNYARKQI